jgi:hypothetical protein
MENDFRHAREVEYTYDRNQVLMLGYKDIKFKEPILKGYFEAHKWDILRTYISEDRILEYRNYNEQGKEATLDM